MNHKMGAYSRNDAEVTGCSDNTQLLSENILFSFSNFM